MSPFDYNTLAEKHIAFQDLETSVITTESEFLSFLQAKGSCSGESLIFRGVKEAKWKITSSCQRAFLSGKVYGQNQVSFIAREIDNIKGAIGGLLPRYYDELGIPVTDFIYLSFLQHYGAPTTLIDFTQDLKTALWMAVSDIQYPAISQNDIDNYFSVYWIDSAGLAEIPIILDIYRSGYLQYCVKAADDYADDNRMKFTINPELDNILESKHSVIEHALNFLKWKNDSPSCLAKTELGFIYTSNVSRHDKRHSLDQIKDEIQKVTYTLANRMSESALKAFKNIVNYLFNEVVKIVNLNLVAQRGCFIHYLPASCGTPLEEDKKMNGIIHCVDIHKSLKPFILKELGKDGICKSSMFPDTEKMAQYAFHNSQSF